MSSTVNGGNLLQPLTKTEIEDIISNHASLNQAFYQLDWAKATSPSPDWSDVDKVQREFSGCGHGGMRRDYGWRCIAAYLHKRQSGSTRAVEGER